MQAADASGKTVTEILVITERNMLLIVVIVSIVCLIIMILLLFLCRYLIFLDVFATVCLNKCYHL